MFGLSAKGRALLSASLVVCCLAILCFAKAGQANWQFKQQQCLDCHKDFGKKYFSMKYLHPGIKESKCEDCHLRHGIIPKLLLKESGDELCLKCHNVKSLGLDRKYVHSALKGGIAYMPRSARLELQQPFGRRGE